jgi:hypothetical protein
MKTLRRTLTLLLIAVCAVFVLAGCGSSQTAESKRSGFYNMETLAANIKEGADQQVGSTSDEHVVCVKTDKNIAVCQLEARGGESFLSESATITINPSGTHFVISHRERTE